MLTDFGNEQLAALKALGWHVQCSPCEISLFRIKKNGAPLKSPDVCLTFSPMISDAVFDGEQLIEQNHRPRVRPWIVDQYDQQPFAFKEPKQAKSLFLELAKSRAPHLLWHVCVDTT